MGNFMIEALQVLGVIMLGTTSAAFVVFVKTKTPKPQMPNISTENYELEQKPIMNPRMKGV